jgi:hypothetical protein
MTEIKIEDKQSYLNENFPFEDIPKLTDQKYCIHCGDIITVGDFKVYKDVFEDEYIYCPNAPECDGTIIDWMPIKD